jgi:hypothetical protein
MARKHNTKKKEEDQQEEKERGNNKQHMFSSKDITLIIIGQKRNEDIVTYFLTSFLWLVDYSHQGDIKLK